MANIEIYDKGRLNPRTNYDSPMTTLGAQATKNIYLDTVTK